MRISNRLVGIVLLAAAAQVALLWWSDVPLGVPGEWTWARIPVDGGLWVTVLTGFLAVALYASLVWAGAQRVRRARLLETTAWLTALVAAGCGWLWVVIDTTPGPLGLGRAPFIIYYPGTSGYFLQARGALEDWPAFLTGYESELEQGDVLHLGTHPPGLTIVYGCLLEFCRAHPAVTDAVLASRPESVRQAMQQLKRNEAQVVPPIDAADAACLWLAALLSLVSAVATVWPLYGLLAQIGGKATAWRLAAFWPLVPSVAVFYPKSDLLYPLVAMLFAWLWLTGWERGAVWRCALAACVLLAGLLLSLAFLPVAAIVGLASVLQWWFGAGLPNPLDVRPQVSPLRRASCLAVAFALFVAGLVAFWWACEVNLLNVWRLNFVNHARFYDEFPRTWWKWLLVNPIELVIAAGVVVTALAVTASARCMNAPLRSPLVLSVILVWGALWLSGKNMGEAARLWILLMPWLLVIAVSGFRTSDRDVDPSAPPGRGWMILIVLQAAVCLLTAHRVDGFHFGELVSEAGIQSVTLDNVPAGYEATHSVAVTRGQTPSRLPLP